MLLLAKNSFISILLVYAFLLSSGISTGFDQIAQPRVCCENEAQDKHSNNGACPDSDCLCMSCISLAPVQSFHINKAPLMESAGADRSQTMHISDFFRSIERPPKSC
jgi:hypothetical protein